MAQKTQGSTRAKGNTIPLPRSRVRNWCFTLNNYTQDEIEELKNISNASIVFQEEKGASGTPHLQGVILFKNPQTLAGVRKHNNRAHFEKMVGTKMQAIRYCTKEDTRSGEIYSNFNWEVLAQAQNKIQKKLDICDLIRRDLERNLYEKSEEYRKGFTDEWSKQHSIYCDMMCELGKYEQEPGFTWQYN